MVCFILLTEVCKSGKWQGVFYAKYTCDPLLTETATLKDLRENESEAFDRLCLELDHSSNGWRALGKECKIKDETLQQIKTPFSCTKLVLEKLKANNPDLSLQDIGDVLEKMNRKDVRKELELLPGNVSYRFLWKKKLKCFMFRMTIPLRERTRFKVKKKLCILSPKLFDSK